MKSFLRCAVAALPLAISLPAGSWAQAPAPHAQAPAAAPGPIRAENPWARASAGQSGTSGAFVTLATQGAPDRLVGASSPVAPKVELHETTLDGGVMRMRPVTGIDIAPGKPAVLAPGGFHIMLMGMPKPLVAGDSFPLTLTFANTAPMTVTVKVVPPGGAAPHSH